MTVCIKRFSRRVILVFTLAVGFLAASEKPARAQFAVTDLPQIGTNLVNTLTEVAEMLKQLGVATDQLDWLDTIMDYAGQLNTLLNDAGTLYYMYNSLQFQLETMKSYGSMIENMETFGISPTVVIDLKNRLKLAYDTIHDMIDQGMKILSDTGISKEEKLKLAQEYADNVCMKSDSETEELQMEIDMIEATRSWQEFDNFISGKSAAEGIGEVGVLLGDDEPEVETSMEEAFGEGAGVMKSAGSMGFRAIALLLGMLVALALVGVTVRYIRGDYKSEGGFMRIFVVIVAGVVLFTVLHAVMKI